MLKTVCINPFTKLCLLFWGCTLLFSACQQEENEQKTERPNVVIFLADDMGFSDIGSYGSEVIETPNLDRLAAEGQSFTQFYNAARCSPTRASLLTGKYPHQSGLGWLAGPDAGYPGYIGHLNETKTIAEVLQQNGYKTIMAGKWHVGNPENDVMPWTRGFDEYFGRPKRADYWNSDDLMMNGEPYEWPEEDFFMTDALGEYTSKLIRDHEQEDSPQPFFMYMAFNAPHWPLHAKDEDIERYRDKFMVGWDEIRQKRYANLIDQGMLKEGQSPPERDPAVPQWDSIDEEKKRLWDMNMSVYAAQVTAMDRAVGRVLDEIERQGEEDNTLILFLSDNGASAEAIGLHETQIRHDDGIPPGGPDSHQSYLMPWANVSNTPFQFYKHWAHEGGIATPFIARWPDVIKDKGSIVDDLGHVMDVMPTVLDIADIDGFEESGDLNMEGKSLLPVFQGESWEEDRRIFWEHEGHRAVRDGKWKLVSIHDFDNWFYEKWGFPRELDRAEWELYDMSEDRLEQNNLADENPEKRDELIKAYQEWADRVGVEEWDDVRPELPLFKNAN